MESNKNLAFVLMRDLLKKFKENPEMMDDNDRENLKLLYKDLCKASNISEHLQWRIEWQIEKWKSTADKLAGVAPYEIVRDGQNVVLDNGANEILKLITGSGTAYNSTNAMIYVGTDNTPENAAQTGVIATGANRSVASMDSGYPSVSGRTAIFRASFGEDTANFIWNEASITNGTGAGSIAMNRKVSAMGTKNGGTWTMQITLTLASA